MSCIVQIREVQLWWAQPYMNQPQTKNKRPGAANSPPSLRKVASSSHYNHNSKGITQYETKVVEHIRMI
jgi:hypothetical protein